MLLPCESNRELLRSSFDLLPASDQTLFTDVGFFAFDPKYRELNGNMRWLCDVHKQDEDEIKHRLDGLKRRGLLQDVDLTSGRISMHDLYREFVRLEARGILGWGTDLEERRWVVVDNGDLTKLESKPMGGCWPKLIRLAISGAPFDGRGVSSTIIRIESLERINWDYFSIIEVLQLIGLPWVRGALNLEHLMGLRSLLLYDVGKLYRLEGLGELKNLTHFTWVRYGDPHEVKDIDIFGQLPTSLKALELHDSRLVLKSDIFARCESLLKLVLRDVEVGTLDLSSCLALESVELKYVRKLQTVSGLASGCTSRLQCLCVSECYDLVEIPGIDYLITLRELSIADSAMVQVPNLLALTELQGLSLTGDLSLLVRGNDCFSRQLRKLKNWRYRSTERLNLDGFNELEVLDLSYCRGLTSLDAMGGLPALRRLRLCWCENLLRLPDLSKSRNLEELDLDGCGCLELHEEDIQMLSELPLLQPVSFSGSLHFRISEFADFEEFKLDFVRRKVLHSSNRYLMVQEWEERDMGAPPITIDSLALEIEVLGLERVTRV